MKLASTLAFVLFSLPLAVSQAGEPVLWNAPAPPPQSIPQVSLYGEGFYWGLHGGANVYQGYEGTERRTIDGTSFALEMREKVGGYGGIKWGYAFSHNSTVKSAFELDVFYNGADYAVDARADGKKFGGATGRFDTGAILGNYIVKFGQGQFQPYIGAGIGGWFGQVNDTRITLDDVGSVRIGTDEFSGGFAWQLMAGADYYFNDTTSFFMEYKYLNYHDIDLPTDDPVQQHLVGAGLRFHF